MAGGADGAVGHTGGDDLQVQTALRSLDERELHGDVEACTDLNFWRVAIDEVGKGSVHAQGDVEGHGETVRFVAIVAHLK